MSQSDKEFRQVLIILEYIYNVNEQRVTRILLACCCPPGPDLAGGRPGASYYITRDI